MDLDNGEILGLVSSPGYDPNFFIEQKYTEQLRGILNHPKSPLLNRAIKGQYPPGSVFKVLMAIAALDSGKITQHTTFNCPGYFEYGGITFGDTCRYGEQNLIESIAHSCNVYFYHTGLLMGADMIHKYARLFSLGELTLIDLPYEKDGFVPSRKQYLSQRKKWYPGNTINMSIGQGDVLTTPLQMVKLLAAVANEGKEVQPHVIKRIGERPVTKYDFTNEIKVDKKIFEIVKKGLRSAVTDYSGTAHTLDMSEVFVAGKTGTAQSAPGKSHHAWFVGYATGEVKKIAFAVFLEYGGSSHNSTQLGRELLMQMHRDKLL
jgi:penicillin-binding protein 2